MKPGLLVLGGFVLAAAACGGSVVFEEDGGQGGSGGTGTTGSNPTKSTTSVGPSPTTGTTSSVGTTDVGTSSVVGTSTGSGVCALPNTNPPNNCPQACSDLFDCGLLFCDGGQLCPGFTPMDKMQFMGGCVGGCMEQMAIVSIIDPGNCDATIQTLISLNFGFEEVCFGGL